MEVICERENKPKYTCKILESKWMALTQQSAWVVGGSVKTPAHGSVGHKHANEIGIIGKKNNIKPESIYYAPI